MKEKKTGKRREEKRALFGKDWDLLHVAQFKRVPQKIQHEIGRTLFAAE